MSHFYDAEILVLRVSKNLAGTFGVCMVDPRFDCQPIGVTYELPWRDNKDKISCVPPGTYRFKVEAHSKGGPLKLVLRLEGVPGRDGVLVHIGNGESDTEGCILVAEEYERYKEKPGVQKSVKGMADVLAYLGERKDGTIYIREGHYQL